MTTFDKILKRLKDGPAKINEGYDAEDRITDSLTDLIDQLMKYHKMTEKDAVKAIESALASNSSATESKNIWSNRHNVSNDTPRIS